MKRFIQFVIGAFVATAVVNEASGQVTALVVGNQTSFNALDGYHGTTGQFLGSGYGTGTGPPGTFWFAYGPNGNMFTANNTANSPVMQFNGVTGFPLGNFVTDSGKNFTFGPNGDMFRINLASTAVMRYDGTTGQSLGAFIPSGLVNPNSLRFGPNGNLFVADADTIREYNGTTGALIGPFTTPGASGLFAALDFLFAPTGDLIVSGLTGPPNDKILRFNGSTGAFLGVFAQGNGISSPRGMTLGPDGNLYLASTSGNRIQRFDIVSGAFLGDFVSSTAHQGPTYIQFSPSGIPEPSAIILLGLASGATMVGRKFLWRAGRVPRRTQTQSFGGSPC
jgi:WD40 repeat protein